MWLDRFDAFLCDLDGCLISGDVVLPGAEAFVAYAGPKLHVLSNNSTDTPNTLSLRLAALGLAVPPERILLAGATALDRLAAETPGARVALYGTEAIRGHAWSLGLNLVASAPDYVLLTRDPGFDYAALNEIVRHILKGARLIVANPDATHRARTASLSQRREPCSPPSKPASRACAAPSLESRSRRSTARPSVICACRRSACSPLAITR